MFNTRNKVTVTDFLLVPFHMVGGFLIGWSIPGFIIGPTNHAYLRRWWFLSIGLALLIPFAYKVYIVLKNKYHV